VRSLIDKQRKSSHFPKIANDFSQASVWGITNNFKGCTHRAISPKPKVTGLSVHLIRPGSVGSDKKHITNNSYKGTSNAMMRSTCRGKHHVPSDRIIEPTSHRKPKETHHKQRLQLNNHCSDAVLTDFAHLALLSSPEAHTNQ
jgi:hypothetical protein